MSTNWEKKDPELRMHPTDDHGHLEHLKPQQKLFDNFIYDCWVLSMSCPWAEIKSQERIQRNPGGKVWEGHFEEAIGFLNAFSFFQNHSLKSDTIFSSKSIMHHHELYSGLIT